MLQDYESDNQGILNNLHAGGIYGKNSIFGPYLDSVVTGVWINADAISNSALTNDHVRIDQDQTNINIFLGLFCPGDTRTASPLSDAAVAISLSNGSLYCASM